jgi:hypothetical protein
MASNPLTMDEHRELARELHAAGARLRELCSLVVGLYGVESRAGFSFLRAAESVDRLRHELQTQAALDWPETSPEQLYL